MKFEKDISRNRRGNDSFHAQKIMFAEFNELCPWLLDAWMAEGKLPNFKQLYDRSTVFETQADVSEALHLEPWIQWYSLHTGLAFDQHQVFHLTEGAVAAHDDLWRVIHDTGRKVGCFASMNSRPFDFADSFFVADPWSEMGNASPAKLNIYNRFIGHNVREYSNPDQSLTLADYARFLSFMTRHGLAPTTVIKIIRQLVSERFGDKRLSYRRVALMDRMQFDVFRHFQRNYTPDFSSFFINSTAHLQHSYWRMFQPDQFSAKPSDDDMALYGDAILFGYQSMDALLGDFISLADEQGATVMFMTALSQQPFLKAEDSGGKHFYRMRDVEGFFKRFDLPFASIDPTMTHQYLAHFECDEDRENALAALTAFGLRNGKQLFDINAREGEGLYFSCNLFTQAAEDEPAVLADGSSIPFDEIFYQIDATKSGCHHPAGALWISGGKHQRIAEPVSILDIFPTTLDMMGIAPQAGGAHTGTSLAGAIAAA
jgi:hypothetical protein